MGWFEDMELLVNVVEKGGLAAAGRKMNLSASTVTSRLKALEKRCKTQLFNRSTRSIALTESGKLLYDTALQVISNIYAVESRLTAREGHISENLRITAPYDFGQQYVSPALVEFSSLHPNITNTIYLSDKPFDLISSGVDLAIRYGNIPDSSIITRKISSNRRVLVASTGYIEKFGIPNNPDDLSKHKCLTLMINDEVMFNWRFNIKNKLVTIKIEPLMICDNGLLLRQLVLNGAGIASKSWLDVKSDVEKGRLVVLFSDCYIGFSRHDKKEVSLQFLYPPGKYRQPSATAFSDFFIDWFEKLGCVA